MKMLSFAAAVAIATAAHAQADYREVKPRVMPIPMPVEGRPEFFLPRWQDGPLSGALVMPLDEPPCGSQAPEAPATQPGRIVFYPRPCGPKARQTRERLGDPGRH